MARCAVALVAAALLLAACGDSDEAAPTTTSAISVPGTTPPQLVGEGESGSTDEPPDVSGDVEPEPTDPDTVPPDTAPAGGQDGQTTETEPDGTRPPDVVIETTVAPEDRLPADDPYCVAGVAMNEAFAAGNEVPDDATPVIAEALFAVAIERSAALAAVQPRPEGAPLLDEFAAAFQVLNDALADVGFNVEFFEDDGSLDAELEILDSESEALFDHVSAICDVQDVDGDPAALAAELVALDPQG